MIGKILKDPRFHEVLGRAVLNLAILGTISAVMFGADKSYRTSSQDAADSVSQTFRKVKRDLEDLKDVA